MKRILSIILALMLLCSAALATEFEGAVYIQRNTKTEVDLDGDGLNESVTLKMEGVPGEEYLALYLFGADGSFHSYDLYVYWMEEAFALDINGDGIKELFVVCDFYSDDYVTYCFNYTDADGLSTLLFTGMDRFSPGEGYVEGGYGRITDMYGSTITLTGSQDVVGTWMASRNFVLTDGRFEMEEGMYMLETAESDWENRPLILKQDITVTADGQPLPLKAGDKLLPVASDRESFVLMTTEGGRSFEFEIAFNEEFGWGWFVNGIYEEDLFEYVPYAD